jgi:hypothetical protein
MNFNAAALSCVLMAMVLAVGRAAGPSKFALTEPDELIKTHTDARDEMTGLEQRGERDIEALRPDPISSAGPNVTAKTDA